MNTKKFIQTLTQLKSLPANTLTKMFVKMDPTVLGHLQVALNQAVRLVGENKMKDREKIKEALRPIVKEVLDEAIATIADLKLKKGSVLQATSNIGRVSKGDKGTVVDFNDWQAKVKWKTKKYGEVIIPISDNAVNLIKKIK